MENKKADFNKKLFDDAYKNLKMGEYAIDCIYSKIKDTGLKELMTKQNKFYTSTAKKLEDFAKQIGYQPKDINTMLKTSSYLSINVKTIFNKSTSHIAEMLIEGTTMGITTLIKEVKQSPLARQELISFSNDIVSHQEKFIESLKDFL